MLPETLQLAIKGFPGLDRLYRRQRDMKLLEAHSEKSINHIGSQYMFHP
jgi:hypothetical protein